MTDDHLEELPDGAGCVEVWDDLSELRADADPVSTLLTRSASHASGNVEKWGLQPLTTILLATVEELAEVAEETVPRQPPVGASAATAEAHRLLNDLETLGTEVQVLHESHWEDDRGRALPEDERPAPVPVRHDRDAASIREELVDTIALLVQADQALRELEGGAGADE